MDDLLAYYDAQLQESPVHPSPMMEPPPQAPHPPPPTAGISISGGFVVMSFHGVLNLPTNDPLYQGLARFSKV